MGTDTAFQSADGVRLAGVLEDAESPRAAALIMHGITAEKEEGGLYTQLAGRLTGMGCSSLRFDFRGHGQSGGQGQDMTVSGELMDVCAAADTARARWGLPLVLIAASFGAVSSLLWYDKTGGDGVAAIVLLNPALDPYYAMVEPRTPWGRRCFTPEARRMLKAEGYMVMPDSGFKLGAGLFAEVARMGGAQSPFPQPYDALSRVRAPVLTIHGDADSYVPFDTAQKYGAPNERSRFVAVPGADHGFAGQWDYITDTVAAWLEGLLPPG